MNMFKKMVSWLGLDVVARLSDYKKSIDALARSPGDTRLCDRAWEQCNTTGISLFRFAILVLTVTMLALSLAACDMEMNYARVKEKRVFVNSYVLLVYQPIKNAAYLRAENWGYHSWWCRVNRQEFQLLQLDDVIEFRAADRRRMHCRHQLLELIDDATNPVAAR
jgi:hypothetical protein